MDEETLEAIREAVKELRKRDGEEIAYLDVDEMAELYQLDVVSRAAKYGESKIYEYCNRRAKANPEHLGRKCVRLSKVSKSPKNCLIQFLDTGEKTIVPIGCLKIIQS